MLAESIIKEGLVYCGTAVDRMAKIGFTREMRSKLMRFIARITKPGVSEEEAQRRSDRLRKKLAGILGCAPDEIVVTLDKVEQKVR